MQTRDSVGAIHVTSLYSPPPSEASTVPLPLAMDDSWSMCWWGRPAACRAMLLRCGKAFTQTKQQ